MFNIDFAVGVFRHVYLVNVRGIVSAAKCVCTNYQSPELVVKRSLVKGYILPSTWALKRKRYPEGRIRKYKARFCVRGDRQKFGFDYDETYAPVVQWSTVRMLLTLTMKLGLKTKQVDYSNAFVQAKINGDVYCELPEEFSVNGAGSSEYVLKLERSLYAVQKINMPDQNSTTKRPILTKLSSFYSY